MSRGAMLVQKEGNSALATKGDSRSTAARERYRSRLSYASAIPPKGRSRLLYDLLLTTRVIYSRIQARCFRFAILHLKGMIGIQRKNIFHTVQPSLYRGLIHDMVTNF